MNPRIPTLCLPAPPLPIPFFLPFPGPRNESADYNAFIYVAQGLPSEKNDEEPNVFP